MPHGEIIEACRLEPDSDWARVAGHNGVSAAFIQISGKDSCVRAFGARDASSGELRLERSAFGRVVRQRNLPLHAPRGLAGSFKKLKTMDGHRVEAAPPLRALESSLTDAHVARLVDRGYVVVDDALAPALCRKLRMEMLALEAHGQMWNSHSYGGNEEGTAHAHINETQLDFKEVKRCPGAQLTTPEMPRAAQSSPEQPTAQ